MKQLILQHPTLAALVVYYVFSAAISALPTPSAASSAFYRWFFGFSHILAGNVMRVVTARFPGATNGALTSNPGVKL
jgi:hypothetical protein